MKRREWEKDHRVHGYKKRFTTRDKREECALALWMKAKNCKTHEINTYSERFEVLQHLNSWMKEFLSYNSNDLVCVACNETFEAEDEVSGCRKCLHPITWTHDTCLKATLKAMNKERCRRARWSEHLKGAKFAPNDADKQNYLHDYYQCVYDALDEAAQKKILEMSQQSTCRFQHKLGMH